MKILFIVPYPIDEAPSQRFRFEQYLKSISNIGHTYHISSFLNTYNWRLFYKSGHLLGKAFALVSGFVSRFIDCGKALGYDFIFIHREACPVGPPVFEWILAKAMRKRIIYDFDDAIWLTDKPNENRIEKFVKSRSKVAKICSWSYKISCGNDYLASYAKQFNANVVVNPTTIDTEKLQASKSSKKDNINQNIVIGWTGSHSTLKYLENISSILKKIEERFENVSFLVIANRAPSLNLKNLTFIEWRAETEIEDLQKMDIGLMPLPDDEWAKGKCGFKALQYMALGIPPVISPVGVNNTIIQYGVNGFLADTEQEWLDVISKLIEGKELRKIIGVQASETVEKNYSVKSNKENFLKLFS
ncbi:MAG: glycosyltransferase family 1 protein [Cytophagia bacterium]|nr:glycosyltransferase family 1 protein [Cytophagia bacterium]